jgi:hypothetical protein
MRLIRWFRSAWADANKSGEWMADAPAFHSLSRWGRWAIRTQPSWDMLAALAFLAIPVLITALLLVFLVVLLIDTLM